MSAKNQIKKKGAQAASGVSDVLETANKAAAEKVGEHVDAAAHRTQEHAVDFIGSLRNAAGAATGQLREDGFTSIANLIDNAAGNIDRVEHRVDGANTADMANSVQEFIRKKPLIAFGGLAVAGFLTAAAMQAARDHSEH